MDGIELEIMWGNLISIVSEQAKALQRTAFSPIVREAGDLATGIFDADARMVSQGLAGTPGHINSLAAAAQNILDIISITVTRLYFIAKPTSTDISGTSIWICCCWVAGINTG